MTKPQRSKILSESMSESISDISHMIPVFIYKRIMEGVFIFVFIVSLFIFISLATYSVNDPTWVHVNRSSAKIVNAGGQVGACVAYGLYWMFGYFSYIIPIGVAYLASLFHHDSKEFRFNKLTFLLRAMGFVFLILGSCALLSLKDDWIGPDGRPGAGGMLGAFLADGFDYAFNIQGATVILSGLILIGLTWLTNLSWFQVFEIIGETLSHWLVSGFKIIKQLLQIRLSSLNNIHTKLRSALPILTKATKANNEDIVIRTQKPNLQLDDSLSAPEIKPGPSLQELIQMKRVDAKKLIRSSLNMPDSVKNTAESTYEPTSSPTFDSMVVSSCDNTNNIQDKDVIDTKIVEEKLEPVTALNHQESVKSNSSSSSSSLKMVETESSIVLPSLSLLDVATPANKQNRGYTPAMLEQLSRDVEQHLLDFGIHVDVVAVHPGPVITRFELQLAAGVKVSRLTALAKDLARALSVISVRIVEVIPGKTVVGLELPNQHREMVRLSQILSAEVYQQAYSSLTLALGVDIAGYPMVVDLAKMPHLLVAGTTGSGKSVGINAMILSLLFRATPEQVRIIMIDPKMLELSVYDGIPHLLTPVVTDMKEAASALRWCVAEMERRYRLLAAVGVRNLASFNTKVTEAQKNNQPLIDPLDKPLPGMETKFLEPLPYVVVIIDELADMMMVVGKKVEQLIARIAQKARAAGIHLILATQRPSVDVLTGLIKSNIPTRISFQVSSKIDSRTILDQQGAEQLLGHGDMLFLAPGTGAPLRVHGAFVDDSEVHRIAEAWRSQGEPNYIDEITQMTSDDSSSTGDDSEGNEADPLYDEAVQFVIDTRKGSISAVQRRFKIGYNRAARLIETMESSGILGPMEGGVRDILVSGGSQ